MHAGSLWSAQMSVRNRPKRFLTGGMPRGRVGRGTMAGVKRRDGATWLLCALAGHWRVVLMSWLWLWLASTRGSSESSPCLRQIARCHSTSSSSQEGISTLVGLALLAAMDGERTGCGTDTARRLSMHRTPLGSAKFSPSPAGRLGWLVRSVMWTGRRSLFYSDL